MKTEKDKKVEEFIIEFNNNRKKHIRKFLAIETLVLLAIVTCFLYIKALISLPGYLGLILLISLIFVVLFYPIKILWKNKSIYNPKYMLQEKRQNFFMLVTTAKEVENISSYIQKQKSTFMHTTPNATLCKEDNDKKETFTLVQKAIEDIDVYTDDLHIEISACEIMHESSFFRYLFSKEWRRKSA